MVGGAERPVWRPQWRSQPPRPRRVAAGTRRFARVLPLARILPLALLLLACAQLEMPPGGPEDRFPPYVIETLPDTFAVVEPGVREIFIRFSERISERAAGGTLDDAVVVSPAVEGVRVRHRRDGILISLGEDLRPDRVYRITILPVVNDMFGNNLRDAFDLVLSTGGAIVPNVVAGMVEDRVTGEVVRSAVVEARFVEEDDTIVHWNVTDAEGVFSLRFVPSGPFEVRSWQDRNRDREAGSTEPQAAFVPGELAEVEPRAPTPPSACSR